jgi:hypothetical protein
MTEEEMKDFGVYRENGVIKVAAAYGIGVKSIEQGAATIAHSSTAKVAHIVRIVTLLNSYQMTASFHRGFDAGRLISLW